MGEKFLTNTMGMVDSYLIDSPGLDYHSGVSVAGNIITISGHLLALGAAVASVMSTFGRKDQDNIAYHATISLKNLTLLLNCSLGRGLRCYFGHAR